MIEWLQSAGEAMTLFFKSISFEDLGVWLLTVSLLIVGIIGSVVPLLPGPIIIFLAGVVHTLLRPETGMSWQGITLLSLGLVLAYAVDTAAGLLGARWFGASRWGILGVFVGGIVGLFFVPLGFIIGPLAGGLVFELLFAKQRLAPAVKSTWGTLLGTGAGLVARLGISLVMVATVLLDLLWI